MTPRCDNRDEWMGPSLYGDLAFTDEAAAAEHLEGCAACRGESEGLKALLGALPPPEPVPVAPRRRSRPWVAAAALLAAVAAGFAAGRGSTPERLASPAVPAPPPPRAAAVSPHPAPAPVSLFSPAALAFLGGRREPIRSGNEEPR
ncbi:MAG: hypothetical protein IT452_05240 [Planctomycetia bacterium]|nr:hypothetical protein [Planctomycetia bacterium]